MFADLCCPLQATCERGFAAMEETHQKVIEDLQRQHQREISKLLEERERLLAEETAATIAGQYSDLHSKARFLSWSLSLFCEHSYVKRI